MLKPSNLITVACCLLPVASLHKSVFNLVQDVRSMQKPGTRQGKKMIGTVVWHGFHTYAPKP
ncbi:MAG: hypothetical protein F6K31_20760 [Symploca sp. SIO2G7]|nr:hypothetical protein [Symploca sp. SIO2G7]